MNLSLLSLTPRAACECCKQQNPRRTSCSPRYDSTCVIKSLLGVAVKAAVTVLKCMVLEECMATVKEDNPSFIRPDNMRLDLPCDKLPYTPMTLMGKSFFSLLCSIWQTGVILPQWSEAQIVNLFKGGDLENTNNYCGISLISCAFKVLISLMASCLSQVTQESGVISKEQASFRKREEAVAQATALAEIVWRH